MLPRGSDAANNAHAEKTEFQPEFIVPLGVVLAVVLLASLFAVAFLIARWQVGQQDGLLNGMAVSAAVVALLCWFWFFRAIQVRRRFAGLLLLLQEDRVTAGAPCRFRITDPDGVLIRSGQLRGQLSYEELLHRRNGRKRYRHGPYQLNVPVSWHTAESRLVNSLEGSFTIPAGAIKTEPDGHWVVRVAVILAVRTAGGRRCRFVLPWGV